MRGNLRGGRTGVLKELGSKTSVGTIQEARRLLPTPLAELHEQAEGPEGPDELDEPVAGVEGNFNPRRVVVHKHGPHLSAQDWGRLREVDPLAQGLDLLFEGNPADLRSAPTR